MTRAHPAANERMAAVWDGEVGRRWVLDADRYERMNAPFGEALMIRAAVQPGEDVLDVGCGLGGRTLDAARAGARAVGVDLSGPMLEVAEARAAELGVAASFRKADAQVDDLGTAAYDLVVSQFGVMFFDDPGVAFAHLASTLRPGGRIVFACWQGLDRQQRLMVPVVAALDHVPVPPFDETDWSHAAFSLAEPAVIESVLTAAGFTGVAVEPLVAAQYQGADVADTVAFLRGSEFADSVFATADPRQVAAGWDAIAVALADFVTPDGVFLDGAAWLVSATRA